MCHNLSHFSTTIPTIGIVFDLKYKQMLKLSKPTVRTSRKACLLFRYAKNDYAIIIVRSHMHTQAFVTFHKIAHIALHDHACTLNKFGSKQPIPKQPEREVFLCRHNSLTTRLYMYIPYSLDQTLRLLLISSYDMCGYYLRAAFINFIIINYL